MTVGKVNQLSGLGSNGGAEASPIGLVRKFGMEGVAQLLGISSNQLHRDLASGQSLAQILQSKGKSLEQGAEAFLGGVQSGLSNAVADGTLTSQQADVILPRATNRLNTLLQDQGSQPAEPSARASGGNGTGLLLDTFA